MFISAKERRENQLYQEAVTALSALASRDGMDKATRAYAETVHDVSLEQWAAMNGLKESRGRCCISRLLGERCTDSHIINGGCYPPGTDHPSLWNKDGKPYCFVSQPYHLSHETLKQIIAFCEANGLEVEIEADPSWHFPGRVLTLIFMKANH